MESGQDTPRTLKPQYYLVYWPVYCPLPPCGGGLGRGASLSTEIARRLRGNPTEAEKRLWSRLRRRQLDGFYIRRQAAIGKYVVDFVCFEPKLVVEVDGGQHLELAARDAQRTAWLETQGYQVIRFWNNDVLENTDGVVETILENLRRR